MYVGGTVAAFAYVGTLAYGALLPAVPAAAVALAPTSSPSTGVGRRPAAGDLGREATRPAALDAPPAPPPLAATGSAAGLPALRGPLLDPAGLLVRAGGPLEAQLRALHAQTGVQLVVYVVPALGQEPIEDLGVRAFAAWQLGRAGTDTGMLLLVAPKERRARIEVGYGLEGVVPDVLAKGILRDRLRPPAGGTITAARLQATVDALQQRLLDAQARGELPAQRAGRAGPSAASPATAASHTLIGAALVAIVLGWLLLGRRLLRRARQQPDAPLPGGGQAETRAARAGHSAGDAAHLAHAAYTLFSLLGRGGGGSGTPPKDDDYGGGGGHSGGGGASDSW